MKNKYLKEAFTRAGGVNFLKIKKIEKIKKIKKIEKIEKNS